MCGHPHGGCTSLLACLVPGTGGWPDPTAHSARLRRTGIFLHVPPGQVLSVRGPGLRVDGLPHVAGQYPAGVDLAAPGAAHWAAITNAVDVSEEVSLRSTTLKDVSVDAEADGHPSLVLAGEVLVRQDGSEKI